MEGFGSGPGKGDAANESIIHHAPLLNAMSVRLRVTDGRGVAHDYTMDKTILLIFDAEVGYSCCLVMAYGVTICMRQHGRVEKLTVVLVQFPGSIDLVGMHPIKRRRAIYILRLKSLKVELKTEIDQNRPSIRGWVHTEDLGERGRQVEYPGLMVLA